LGAGLHSYGFGSGGVEYVSIFVVIHILFVFYVGIYRKLKEKES
jgi:predicted permease